MNENRPRRVPVTKHALVQRVNRKLRKDRQALREVRGAGQTTFGSFIIVSLEKREVVERNVDLERLSRRLKVLEDWEELVET